MNNIFGQFDGFPLLGWMSRWTKIRSGDSPDNVYADCVFCGGENTLAASKNHKIFRCFRCYEGGHAQEIWRGTCGLVKMMMLVEKCDRTSAMIRISNLMNVGLSITKSNEPNRPAKPQDIWPKDSLWLKECSKQNPGKLMLQRRGVGHLEPYCKYCVDGRYMDRVIIPANWLGETKGWEAKAVYPHQKPKALYPNWFRTGESLYSTSWDWSNNFAVITESILDAETFGVNAVGIFGSFLKDSQFSLLLQLRSKGTLNLIWALDADALKKSINTILTKASVFFNNYVLDIPVGEDPNSLGQHKAWGLVSRAQQISNEEDVLPILLKADLI